MADAKNASTITVSRCALCIGPSALLNNKAEERLLAYVASRQSSH